MMSRLRKSPAETLQDYYAASDMAEASIADVTDKVLPARGPDGVSDGSRPGPSDGAAGETTEVTHGAHNTPTLLKLVPLRTMTAVVMTVA